MPEREREREERKEEVRKDFRRLVVVTFDLAADRMLIADDTDRLLKNDAGDRAMTTIASAEREEGGS